MAATTHKTVASLMQKTLNRQASNARFRLKFTKGQIEKIILNFARNGALGPYNELVKVLKEYPLNDDNYRIVFDECLSCVVVLGPDFNPFIDVVCEIDWVGREPELVDLYSRFVLNLVTAHTYHCPKVMTSLVKLLKDITHPSTILALASFDEFLHSDGENWVNSPSPDLINQWSNIHTIIAQIVAIIPMTSDLLMHIVIEQFPYYKAGCFMNRAYIHNLIWMSKYIPSLREQIMTAIINRLIIMDVNIVELHKNKCKNDMIFEMDEEKDEVSETLDYCMLEVLRWLEDERDPILAILCNVFEKIILPTHGIRYVQFLLLYTISINQQCADRILSNLWIVAAGLQGLGPGSLSTRRTAASHLAGLLARCVRVPNSRLIHYLKTMADWCHSYITATQESTTATDNLKAHGAFHAICHALFYLVAFKNHHLFMNKENLIFVESLNLPRLVTCALNPLRSCPPQVTRAFASVTRQHQVAYCQAVVERNSRHTLQAHAHVHYDEWFPYDPYALPVSGKIIWPLCIEYKDWSRVGEDETQYAGMKKKMEADDDDYLMGSPCQKLASSLSNGVSAGFRTSENTMV